MVKMGHAVAYKKYSKMFEHLENEAKEKSRGIWSGKFERPQNWRKKNIRARFICALSISYLNKNLVSVIGKVEGKISNKAKGKNGFGYDPIFIPNNENQTFGQMSFLKKYKIDHRFNAFKKIKKFL